MPPSRASTPTPGLLRIGYNALSRLLFEQVVRAGFDDLRPAHGNVLEQLSDDDGLRLKDMAARAGITAQSTGELVDDLTRLGYVERRPDPSDRRAKRIHLTAKGRRNARAGADAVAHVERDLREALGSARYARLRRDLEALVDAYAAEDER